MQYINIAPVTYDHFQEYSKKTNNFILVIPHIVFKKIAPETDINIILLAL